MAPAAAVAAPAKVVKARPAESLTALGTTIMLLLKALGLDADVAFYSAALLGYAPAAITWLVHTIRS